MTRERLGSSLRRSARVASSQATWVVRRGRGGRFGGGGGAVYDGSSYRSCHRLVSVGCTPVREIVRVAWSVGSGRVADRLRSDSRFAVVTLELHSTLAGEPTFVAIGWLLRFRCRAAAHGVRHTQTDTAHRLHLVESPARVTAAGSSNAPVSTVWSAGVWFNGVRRQSVRGGGGELSLGQEYAACLASTQRGERG